jgi:flavin reductase (DIM6/NTAB) family NADH-FMN oxidoreductase RutF
LDGTMQDLTFVPGRDTERSFRDALGRFATGVTLVTAAGPHGPVGFTANSFAALSLDPPLVLWSPAKHSQRHGIFTRAEHFAIHVLHEGQLGLMKLFHRGGSGFADVPHATSPEGVPLLSDALARFECARHALFDGGDHSIVVGRVLRAEVRAGAPLVFSAGRYGSFAGER